MIHALTISELGKQRQADKSLRSLTRQSKLIKDLQANEETLHTHIHKHKNTGTVTHTCSHTCLHTHIHTHVATHTHTNLTILYKTHNFKKKTSKSYIISSLNNQNSQKCRISSSKHIEYIIKVNIIELERWLRAHSVLTENLSSFTSTCIGWLTTNCNSVYNGV